VRAVSGERAAVAGFTEELAWRVAGADQAIAEVVWDVCGDAAIAVLWPESTAGPCEVDGSLAGWVR
jgi:hypothetical protein